MYSFSNLFVRSLAISSFLGVALFTFVQLSHTSNASSTGLGYPMPLAGYAWSSTIGWISMSCVNTGTCATSDYRVSILPDGSLDGYAWSSHIGWIKFGGLGSFPAGAGTTNANAAAVGTYPDLNLVGWARACAGTDGGDCSSMATAPGGWDGWISLSGSGYGVSFDSSGARDSYAWGGGGTTGVVGWVQWDGVTYDSSSVPAPNIITFVPDNVDVSEGDPVTVTYEVEYADTCTASNNRSVIDWDGLVPSDTGTPYSATANTPLGDTIFTLTCTNPGGSISADFTVETKPDIQIGAFSMVPIGTPHPTGIEPVVEFLVDVSGIPSAVGAVQYRLSLGGDNVTGTLGNGATTITMNNVPYTSSGNAAIRVDQPFPGVVDEDLTSTGANEDHNRRQVVATIPIPDPTITVTATEDFVRRGESVDITIDITTFTAVTCTYQSLGTATDITLPLAGDPAPVPGSPAVYSNTFTVPDLQNTSVFKVTCGTVTESVTVEVIPAVQEV
jgi:hypothetical protein